MTIRFVAVMLFWALTGPNLFAHKILADCKLVGQDLIIQTYYEDDSPADYAKIQILHGSQILSEFQANSEGIGEVRLELQGEYRIRIEHYGHLLIKSVIVDADLGAKSLLDGEKTEKKSLYYFLTGLAGIAIFFVVFAYLKKQLTN